MFSVKTGELSSAPRDTCSLRYFHPGKTELHHSLRLGDWWRDTCSSATTFDIEASVSLSTRRTRQHKLMSEAQPDEYFDCTVEVRQSAGLRTRSC